MIDDKDVDDSDNVELLLQKVLHYSCEMTLDELSVCFLYLTKSAVKMRTDVMKTLLELILKILKNRETSHTLKSFTAVHNVCSTGESSNIPLSALSRFVVAVNINPQLYKFFICQDILPHIFHHLDRVATGDDFRLLTICLINIHQLLSPDTIELYTRKVQQLIADDQLKDDTRIILKILQFLSFPHWSKV